MLSTRGAFYLLLLALIVEGSYGSTRYFVKLRTDASDLYNSRNSDNLKVLHHPISGKISGVQNDAGATIQDEDQSATKDLGPTIERRNSFEDVSTFDPDVLNKFLEEYANKIKSTTENSFKNPFRVTKPIVKLGTKSEQHEEKEISSSENLHNLTAAQGMQSDLNDTNKRNSYSNSNSHEDRNGWVTLDAIPWSKSKISKWQANTNTQKPWPDMKPYDKPDKPNVMKPWQSDYSSRPTYESSKPWYNRPKPHWSENTADKPWYSSEHSKPSQPTKPSYLDRYDNPSQAQKWPPESASWNKYQGSYRPTSDIITDERPSNFPSSYERPQVTKPSYSFADKYTNQNNPNDWNDRDYPPKYEQNDGPPNFPRPSSSNDRPNFSQYQYLNDHPPTHPSSGDGQWILLSTNHGYTKSRQRSIKVDALNGQALKISNSTQVQKTKKDESNPPVAAMTSRRQVRLTVLPSVNGTNTTTSHGGLLEVERTFKTVDQSQKEYEMDKTTRQPNILKARPIRNSVMTRHPSNSAVLAAVGAGLLPATMAMMIPIMLGRKKRATKNSPLEHTFIKSFYITDKHNDQRTKLLLL